jgi:nucleotide-binding universal stress UspA family protein
MLPIHTILHPTDFSEQSAHALRLACALARDYGARLVLLHVAPLPVPALGEGLPMIDPETYLAPLRQRLSELMVPYNEIAVERIFGAGDPAAEISRIALQTHADLIVMGTHGRSGLERLLMGSVTEGVMRQANCPVLTLKLPVPVKAPMAMVEPAPHLSPA